MDDTGTAITTIRNIALWFGSLFISVSFFSLLYGSVSFPFVFRISMIFALPVALLYLPFVISIRDAEDGRIWTLLGSGILIGPVSLGIWGAILGLGRHHSIWEGDGIGLGLATGLILAFAVGFLNTALYVISLKVVRRLTVT